MKSFYKYLVLIVGLLASGTSEAYLSLYETAELLQSSQYRLGLAPQLLLSDGGGGNISAFLDMPFSDSVNARVTIGGGTTDFYTGLSAKWVPFPDFEKQPALGLRGALIYARDASFDFYNFQLTPIISKTVESKYGPLTPYVGVPVTLIYTKNSNTTAAQFAIGTEWNLQNDFQMGAELSLNLSKTISTLSVYFNFPFDQKKGYRR